MKHPWLNITCMQLAHIHENSFHVVLTKGTQSSYHGRPELGWTQNTFKKRWPHYSITVVISEIAIRLTKCFFRVKQNYYLKYWKKRISAINSCYVFVLFFQIRAFSERQSFCNVWEPDDVPNKTKTCLTSSYLLFKLLFPLSFFRSRIFSLLQFSCVFLLELKESKCRIYS